MFHKLSNVCKWKLSGWGLMLYGDRAGKLQPQERGGAMSTDRWG